MRTSVRAGARELYACLEDLRPLFGKGNNLIPVLFKVKADKLIVCCTSGCIYYNRVSVINEGNYSGEITVQYKNILDFIPKSGEVELQFHSYGLVFSSNDADIKLPIGYSIVTEHELKDIDFIPVDSQNFRIGINNMLNMGLSTIYKTEKNINIYGNVSTLMYPNVILQARTPGLPLAVTLTQDFAKHLSRFAPKAIASNKVDSVILKRDDAYLEIPAEPLKEENNFMKHMNGLSEPLRLDTEHYIDKLRNMSKLGNNVRAKLAIFKDGVRVTVEQDNISISSDLGNCSDSVLKVLYLPLSLYISMFKALGSTVIEMLYGKEIICLRSPALIIIARAIL